MAKLSYAINRMHYLRCVHSEPVICLTEIIKDQTRTIGLIGCENDGWRGVRLSCGPGGMEREEHQE
jgi:hypothetical protein